MSVTLRNVSRLGTLVIPSLGITVAPDEVFVVTDEQAQGFVGQEDTFVVVDEDIASEA